MLLEQMLTFKYCFKKHVFESINYTKAKLTTKIP